MYFIKRLKETTVYLNKMAIYEKISTLTAISYIDKLIDCEKIMTYVCENNLCYEQTIENNNYLIGTVRFPLSKKKENVKEFKNQIQLHIPLHGENKKVRQVKIKVFNNGRLHMTGLQSVDKLKKEHSKNEFSIEFSHQDVLKNTIPEYLETCKNYYFVFLQNSINQFKLSLLYGYIIILGYENNAMNVVGFDEKNFLLRKVDNEIMHVDHDTLVQNCFDPCVLYSLSGCDREINLGFVR